MNTDAIILLLAILAILGIVLSIAVMRLWVSIVVKWVLTDIERNTGQRVIATLPQKLSR